ncbi:MAG: DUF2332 family protein [Candidatus Nanopelagicales bacterium]
MGLRRDDRPGLEAIFTDIGQSCRRLGAPTYATWADCVLQWRDEEPLRSLLAPYAEARIGDMIPLRLFAALHGLALQRQAPDLAIYLRTLGGTPPCDAEQRERMCRVLLSVIDAHRALIADALTKVPQTNEVGRAVGLAALLRRVHRAFELPVDLREIGCSAGLSLRVDALVEEGVITGDHPEWGDLPALASRAGCDLAPVDASTPDGRSYLTSFVWADHVDRFERLRRALALAPTIEAELVRGDALDYIRSLALVPGRALVVWHSAMWLYLSPEQRATIREVLDGLGARATAQSPLVHIWLEPVSTDAGGQHRFALTMASWPGVDGLPAGIEVPWGYAPPAGEPVEWSVPCAGAVVRDHEGRILLVRRGQAPSRGMWSLPGGRIESGETWADAAVREVSEETGIAAQDPVFIGIVERDSESGSTYVIADYAMRGAGCPAPGDDADDARWCDARDIEALVTSPGLVEALREWGELPEG